VARAAASPPDDWRRIFDVDFFGVAEMTRRAAAACV